MSLGKKFFGALAAATIGSLAIVPLNSRGAVQPLNYPLAQQASGATRSIGAIESINGNTIVMKTDAGVESSVAVSDSTKILRIEPGQKTLSGATVIHLADLQFVDRVMIT